MKTTKIYLKPRHLKRGYKLAELPSDASRKDCWDWLVEHKPELTTHPIQRSWVKEGKTIIDYGSHYSKIIIHKTFEEEEVK